MSVSAWPIKRFGMTLSNNSQASQNTLPTGLYHTNQRLYTLKKSDVVIFSNHCFKGCWSFWSSIQINISYLNDVSTMWYHLWFSDIEEDIEKGLTVLEDAAKKSLVYLRDLKGLKSNLAQDFDKAAEWVLSFHSSHNKTMLFRFFLSRNAGHLNTWKKVVVLDTCKV